MRSLYNELQFSCKYIFDVSVPVQNKEECPISGQRFATSSFEEKNNFCHQWSQHCYVMGSRLPDAFDTGCDVKCLSLPSLIFIGHLCFEFCCISAHSIWE